MLQDHAHASSRNRFSIRTAYITVLQHERKPATTGSFVMFLNSLWNPPTCTMPQGEKIAALSLMLECVSILAGILVVSGPSKLEFGDVWGKDICKSCVKVWIIMRVCIYSLCLFMFSVLYVSFLIYNRCLFYKLLKWDFGTMAVAVSSFYLVWVQTDCAATARAFFSWMDNFPCMTSYGILWHYGWFNDAFQGQRHQIQYTCVLKWMGKACEDSNVHVAKKTQPGAWWVNWWNSFPDNLPSFALVPRKSQRVPGQQVSIIRIYEDGFAVSHGFSHLFRSSSWRVCLGWVIAIFMVGSFRWFSFVDE